MVMENEHTMAARACHSCSWLALCSQQCASPTVGKCQVRVGYGVEHVQGRSELFSVGAVLYTTYLQTLGSLHHPASASLKRVFPPPPVIATFSAGFGAGIVQAVIATPLDALQLRFKANELLDGRYKHMWDYGLRKSKAVGFRGLYAGLSLSLLKDSLGFGAFFATFEYIKAQCFYAFVTRYYGNIQPHMIGTFYQEGPDSSQGVKTIKPYFAVEPSFLLLAGILASITLQLIQQPLTRFQRIYFGSLQSLDRLSKGQMSRKQQQKNSKVAYHKTYEKCVAQARTSGGWRIWMYKGLIMNTLKQVPSTSAGLVIFEMVRRRYADETTAVRIEKDGYDILLT